MSENPTSTEQTDNSQASTPATPQGNNGGNEATFTQSEVDKTMGRVRAETRDIVQKKLLEDLGIESIDSLKSLVTDAQKRKEAEMSEAQKLQAQIDAANKARQDAEQKLKDMETRVLNEQRRNVLESAITANGGTNAKRLYMLVQAEKGTEFAALFGDDATVDDGKLKAFIKQVQADFPEYFGNAGAGSPSNANGFAPNSQNTSELEKRLKKKFGRM